MTSTFILGAIVGFMLGLLLVYWKQIVFLQQNAGLIGDVTNVVQSGQNIIQKL